MVSIWMAIVTVLLVNNQKPVDQIAPQASYLSENDVLPILIW